MKYGIFTEVPCHRAVALHPLGIQRSCMLARCSYSATTAMAPLLNSIQGFPLNWRAWYVIEYSSSKYDIWFLYNPWQIERHVFEATINRLNEFYAEAEEGSCGTYCEGCIGCITAYLIYMCSETHYEKVSSLYTLIRLKAYIFVLFFPDAT